MLDVLDVLDGWLKLDEGLIIVESGGFLNQGPE